MAITADMAFVTGFDPSLASVGQKIGSIYARPARYYMVYSMETIYIYLLCIMVDIVIKSKRRMVSRHRSHGSAKGKVRVIADGVRRKHGA